MKIASRGNDVNEVVVSSMLESDLFQSLSHMATVTGLVVDADVVAGRVYEAPKGVLSTIVYPRNLRLEPHDEFALQDWPTQEQSIFVHGRQRELSNGVYRPRSQTKSSASPPDQWFEPIEAHAAVVDALCMSFPVLNGSCCMLACLRCEPSREFDDHQLALLEQLKPNLIEVIRTGLERQMGRHTPPSTPPPMLMRPGQANELLGKLSPTEDEVLGHIRSGYTERQIAETLHRSPHTVHVHVKNIYRKLGVNSRKQLVEWF